MKGNKKESCGICKVPFERNNYYYGKLMTVRDFFTEQCYFNEKRWLINRTINGWGIVCGFEVQKVPLDPNDLKKGYDINKILITPGLAIDCCGREIVMCEEQIIDLNSEVDDCCKEEKKNTSTGDQQKSDDKKKNTELIICLEYYECKTEPVNLPPIACDQKEKGEFNRIRDSFKILVKSKEEVELKEHCKKPCPLDHKQVNLHSYLCKELKDGCCECPEHLCLILAEIKISSHDHQSEDSSSQESNVQDSKETKSEIKSTKSKDKTSKSNPDQPQNGKLNIYIDECSKRKLVYNNKLLFDLINCYHGNLPHVIKTNWDNGQKIKLQDFKEGICNKDVGIKVWFDKKMNENTINENTFLFLVKMENAETGNSRYEQVPGSVEYSDNAGESLATFKIESDWIKDVYSGYSRIREKGGEFKVILKGDFIMSEEENNKDIKALDGNFIGGQFPSGNGVQGGDFESWFFVEEPQDKKKSDASSK